MVYTGLHEETRYSQLVSIEPFKITLRYSENVGTIHPPQAGTVPNFRPQFHVFPGKFVHG